MIIGSATYDFHRYYSHDNVVWIPYSSPVQGCSQDIAFNPDPIPKVLVSGSIAADRPLRTYVASVESEFIERLGHPGYEGQYSEDSEQIVRTKFFLEMNKYLCCFTDGHAFRYVHAKNFEIPSVGSLLLTDSIIEPEMNRLGFVDFETCIFCNQENFLERLAWIVDEQNRPEVDRIRLAGMQMVRARHLTEHRAAQINDLVRHCTSTQGEGLGHYRLVG